MGLANGVSFSRCDKSTVLRNTVCAMLPLAFDVAVMFLPMESAYDMRYRITNADVGLETRQYNNGFFKYCSGDRLLFSQLLFGRLP